MNGKRAVVGDFKLRIDRRGRTFMQTVSDCVKQWKTGSQFVKAPRTFAQDRQRARALSPSVLGYWAESSPVLFINLSFSFIPRAKTIIENGRKMIKL